MKLKISGYNIYSETMLYLHCPQCGKTAEINLPTFIVAVNLDKRYSCVDCGCDFRIEVVRLPRADELRNEAVEVDAGADERTKKVSTED